MGAWLIVSLTLVTQAAAQLHDVQCEGVYPKHLQGIATDDQRAIFWCFTDVLLKTDLDGHILKKVPVANHHGDLCYADGRVYVAVNLGKFNQPEGKADSWVYVYDPADLRETARYRTPEVVYGAGAIGYRQGRFFVAGGLPIGVNENYVYEYDGQFRFIARHVVASGYTRMGIQTATFGGGHWWFGCYGKPHVLLRTDAAFGAVERFTLDAALGIVALGDGRFLVARRVPSPRWGCRGSAVVVTADPARGVNLPPPPVDVLLRGGMLYDGSGSPGVVGDVAIGDGKIVAVGKCPVGEAGRVIDCAGLVVAPGFIDLHTHCDPTGSLEKRRNLNYLTQGCTTVMTGNCGGGPVDIGAYYERLVREGCGTNVMCLVPHGSVRARVMGGGNRTPTPDELQRMRQGVDRGMREGAWGMSTGLIYAPGMFAKTDELIALAAVVGRHHGLYVTHLRNEAQDLLPAVREALRIGREANVPVHVSHFKAVGPRSWGSVHQAAAAIDEARAAGLRVTADQYPYIATSTSVSAVLFPATEIPGGLRDFARRMETDADYRRAVRQVVERRLPDNPRIVIADCKRHPDWAGKSLAQIATELKTDLPGAAIRIETDGGASVVRFVLSEEDVRWVMQVPWVATASDGNTMVPGPGGRPHPRSFGTFPRKIGFYAQREKVLSVAQAVRSATGLPADILGLSDRGYLRVGAVADLVVFDPATFIDRATFDDPQQYSTGVRWLLLAGQAAIANGKPAAALYGQALRHTTASDAGTRESLPRPAHASH